MFTIEAEERCGHLVSVEMKKLWSAQMEILREIQRICQKHDIKYFAIEGTLLGAVRHRGFIPWDDDIDIGMYFEDYDRFCEVVKCELPEYYGFQHYSTQDGFNIGFARVRDTRTTAATKADYELFLEDEGYNFGVFVDIFPLFDVPETTLQKRRQQLKGAFSNFLKRGYTEEIRRRKGIDAAESKKQKLTFAACYYSWKIFGKFTTYKKAAHRRYKAMKMYKNSSRIGLTAFYGYLDKFIWDKSLFAETIELPFEDMTITCPKEYDKILRKRYGDYEVFVKGGALHTFAVLDCDTPYCEKLKSHREKAE